MSMTTITIKINHDAKGNVTITQNGNTASQLEICEDQNMLIKPGTGFSDKNSKITELKLFTNDNHSKGTLVGHWKRLSPSDQPSPLISVTEQGNNILLDDVNNTDADGDFFFAVTANDGSQNYCSDPELKVKKLRRR